MANLLKALTWRIRGSYDPNGPVTEDGSIRARNRAKYEAWKYVTFGPGRDVCNVFHRDPDLVYRIIDSGQLQEEPLHVNDPWEIAGLVSIIAEMEGHKFVSMMTPVGALKTREDVDREENTAIDRVVRYLIPMPIGVIPSEADRENYQNYQRHFKEMLETLKKRNNP